MIKYLFITTLFTFLYLSACGQFFDDFSDSDLTNNPTWEGDLVSFIVNENGELQLDSNDDDPKIIYTMLDFPDTITWEMRTRMEFSPSDNNKLRIYLSIDDLELSEASGYFIEIGENGSADALHLYFLNEGEPELIASGMMGALSGDPAVLNLRIDYYPDGTWEVLTAYNANEPLETELIFNHNLYSFSTSQYFGFECTYTASRSDLFFFDDVGINKFELDKTGPEVLSVRAIDPLTIEIQCNEELDPSSAFVAENFDISDYSGTLSSSSLINGNSGILLTLTTPLMNGVTYTLTIQNLKDTNLNTGEPASFEIFVVGKPVPGDLLVSEILFNPVANGFDYVELYNNSDKFIDLNHIVISNEDRNDSEEILGEYLLLPGKYICITEDASQIQDQYLPPDTAWIVENDLPAFNNDTGNVSILAPLSEEILDAFNYSETMHFSSLDDLNGVSLERISFDLPTRDRSNWFSAAATNNFGTPGYENSNFKNISLGQEEVISFEKSTFSPNQDGIDDQLVIQYSLPDNGYLVDLDVYSQTGIHVRKLINNQLLPNNGILLWDGLNKNGELSRIGIYLIVLEGYNSSGSVISIKKPIILADYLK